MNQRASEPLVAGRTIVDLMDEYLSELDNPAPDYGMRNVYRDWMREMVEAHRELSS